MDRLKIATWNIEHSDKLIDALAEPNTAARKKAEDRRDAIAEEILMLDADILQVCEGPNGEARAEAFFAEVAPDYDLVVRGVDDRDAYGMKGTDATTGRQWIWFLLRKGTPITARLLHLDRWKDAVTAASDGRHADGRWAVSWPELRRDADGAEEALGLSVPERHSHWRHPQVLQAEVDGHFLELIGCHLKSKINRTPIVGDADDPDFFERNPALVADVIKSRTKLTTEASDIRHYLNARFAEDADAAVVILGDLNDGPGKERIEARFLYHDLVTSLQGDVFFARRFLNHALFDLEESERWSVQFRDRLDPGRDPRILLDHVLFSQSMTRSHTGTPFAYRARPRGGKVEHEAHHRTAASWPRHAATSDHRPVSMVFDRIVAG